MDYSLSEDQALLRDTVRKFLEQTSPLTAVREQGEQGGGFRRAWWRQAAELGWTAMLIPEEFGGGTVSGHGVLDLAIIAEEAGRLVAPGPLQPVNVVAAAVADRGTREQQLELLPGLASGEQVATPVLRPPSWLAESADSSVTADRTEQGFVLRGSHPCVESAGDADWFLVTARVDDEPWQLVVPASAAGLTVTPLDSLDLARTFGQVDFADVTVAPGAALGGRPCSPEELEYQLQVGLVLQCAEMVGAIATVFDFTVKWAFDRYSFGRPLASYQALKHRFADLKMWVEACAATATGAARAVQDRGPDAGEYTSVAKACIGEHAPEIVQDCVQLHGGIGLTWEHDLHLYLRRVTVDRALLGSPAEHLDHVAVLLGA
jgi:alkylation response protein AidB-like acyl-CoA dehydrogenase